MELKWNRIRVNDLGTIITGHTPSRKDSKNFGGLYTWIKPTDIEKDCRFVNNTEENYSDTAYQKYKKSLLPPLTTCVVTIGTIGEKICLTKEPSFTNQAINSIIPNENKFDPKFVYYLMKYNLPIVAKRNSGTASGRQNVSKTNFGSIQVEVPEYAVQLDISKVLSTFDDLIEVDAERIRIIEQLSYGFYNQCLINSGLTFDENNLHLTSVPDGWTKINLFEASDVTFGKPFQSTFFNDSNGFPIVRIRDLLNNKTKTFTTETVEEKYVVENGDILVGMDGIFHMSRWAGGEAGLVQRVVRFRPKSFLSSYFLFWALKRHIEYFNQTITGTTVAHLGKEDLEKIDLLIPKKALLERMNEVLEPLYQLEIALRAKNLILKKTRDLLLPELMSGALDAKKLLEE